MNIIQNVANFFINTLAVINDTIVAPLLKSAQTIFNALAADVKTALDQFEGNVSSSLTNFSSQLDSAAANATNFVTGLVSNLTTLLGNVGYCYDTYAPAVQGFAENFLPYVASCVQESSFNASNIANNATVVVNKTETLVNNLIANLTSCVKPVLASPNLYNAKLTAMSCLNNVSICSGFWKSFFLIWFLFQAISGAATSKVAIIANIIDAKIKLAEDIATALVQVGKCFGTRVYESVVGANMINGFIVDCLNTPRE